MRSIYFWRHTGKSRATWPPSFVADIGLTSTLVAPLTTTSRRFVVPSSSSSLFAGASSLILALLLLLLLLLLLRCLLNRYYNGTVIASWAAPSLWPNTSTPTRLRLLASKRRSSKWVLKTPPPIPGYTIIRRDQPGDGYGKSVAILVHHSVSFSPIDTSFIANDPHIEIVASITNAN